MTDGRARSRVEKTKSGPGSAHRTQQRKRNPAVPGRALGARGHGVKAAPAGPETEESPVKNG
jgi:hypothetical protein